MAVLVAHGVVVAVTRYGLAAVRPLHGAGVQRPNGKGDGEYAVRVGRCVAVRVERCTCPWRLGRQTGVSERSGIAQTIGDGGYGIVLAYRT